MKFKFKIAEDTTNDDVKKELDRLLTVPMNEIPMSHLVKITRFLGCEPCHATGSSIRFYHKLLADHVHYRGYIHIHQVHKGGNERFISKPDYKKYLYPVLMTIIEVQNNIEQSNL